MVCLVTRTQPRLPLFRHHTSRQFDCSSSYFIVPDFTSENVPETHNNQWFSAASQNHSKIPNGLSISTISFVIAIIKMLMRTVEWEQGSRTYAEWALCHVYLIMASTRLQPSQYLIDFLHPLSLLHSQIVLEKKVRRRGWLKLRRGRGKTHLDRVDFDHLPLLLSLSPRCVTKSGTTTCWTWSSPPWLSL